MQSDLIFVKKNPQSQFLRQTNFAKKRHLLFLQQRCVKLHESTYNYIKTHKIVCCFLKITPPGKKFHNCRLQQTRQISTLDLNQKNAIRDGGSTISDTTTIWTADTAFSVYTVAYMPVYIALSLDRSGVTGWAFEQKAGQVSRVGDTSSTVTTT